MEYLKEYASNIIIISILATIFDILAPDGKSKKYITMVLGLIVMLCVMHPFKAATDIKKNFFNIPTFEIEEIVSLTPKNLIADKFEENLALEIIRKVKEKKNNDINCIVTTERNENGEITGIKKVEITPYNEADADYISSEFGIDKNILKGDSHD